MAPIRLSTINFDINGEKEIKTNNVGFFPVPDEADCVVWLRRAAVHHFNVPARLDVLDRFIALHYTDWELLNGRDINKTLTSGFVIPAVGVVSTFLHTKHLDSYGGV